MSLDSILSDILISTVREKRASDASEVSREKTASVNLTNEDALGLIKLSSLLREVKVEPTYEDLYTFVGGLYERR